MALPCVPWSKVLFSYGYGMAVNFLDGFVAIMFSLYPSRLLRQVPESMPKDILSVVELAMGLSPTSENDDAFVASTRHGHDGE